MAKPKKPKKPPADEKPLAEETGRTPEGNRIVAVQATCTLSDHERLRKGSEMAEADQEVERLKGEKASQAAGYNDSLKKARERRKALREAFLTSTEKRMVSCVELPDYNRGVIELRRVDGNDLVDTRTMTEDERQLPLRMAQEQQQPASDELSADDRATAEAIRGASDWIEQHGGKARLVVDLRGLDERGAAAWLETKHAPAGVLDQLREDLERDAIEREQRRAAIGETDPDAEGAADEIKTRRRKHTTAGAHA